MRRVAAAAIVLLAPAVVGCDDDAPPGSSTAAKPSTSSSSTPSTLKTVRTRIPADPGTLAAVNVSLPRRMPTGDEDLPSLLDHPPGRAVMAYRPIERLDDAEGWSGETIYLLGADGQWRRLRMVDFGLPDAWWPGSDMYGVGKLSPNGRMWATHAGPDVLLLDLRTARWRLVRVAGGPERVRWAWWLPDGRSLQVHAFGTPAAPSRHTTYLVDVVTGEARRSPYGEPVAFEPDGTAVALRRGGLGSHRLRWASETAVPEREPVPNAWARSGSFTASHGDEAFALPIDDDLLAIDRSSLRLVGRLVNEDRGGYGMAYGWLDASTLLISTRSWVLTWTPATGTLHRVARMPTVPVGVWAGWNISVALDLLRPPTSG